MTAVPPKPAAPTKKPRSPVERVIVWGGIAVLLGLAAYEAHARFGYELTLQKLQARLASDDDGSLDGAPLLVSEVPQLIVGFPSSKLEEDRHWRAVTYSWHGLRKTHSIRMPYDTSEEKPVVLSLETSNPPAEPTVEELLAAAGTAEASEPDLGHAAAGMGGGPGAGGPGGGGPGGGGPRPDIMESDKDGDGKVSKEETPERMAAFFDRMDANSDGFIDADEAAAARQRRAAGGGRGGPPGGAGGEARRPEPETDAPADAADAVKSVATEAAAPKPADEKPAEQK